MDLSSLTLPSLSQSGQKNTSKKKLVKPEVKNYLATYDVYQRAGLVLSTSYGLSPTPNAADAIVASNDSKMRLAIVPDIINIETALSGDYAIVVSIELYEESPKEGSVLKVPDIDSVAGHPPSKEILDIIQIVLFGYDRKIQMFFALTQDEVPFTIAYNYVEDELVAFDLWAVAR